jgi:hypothetical protein
MTSGSRVRFAISLKETWVSPSAAQVNKTAVSDVRRLIELLKKLPVTLDDWLVQWDSLVKLIFSSLQLPIPVLFAK